MEKHTPSSLDEFREELAGEVLSEVAERFFGDRLEIEQMHETLDLHIGSLRNMSERIGNDLAALETLLIHDTGRKAFFDALDIDRTAFPDTAGRVMDDPAVFPEMPKAWTRKKRYVLWVAQAYDRFQKECHRYRYGGGGKKTTPDASEEMITDVELIREMATLLNKKIHKVNNQTASECTLQFVRSMDLQTAEAERFTGAVIPGRYTTGLTESMCYLPIDIENLPIVIYPVPPEYEQIKNRLHGILIRFYGQNRKEIDPLMKEWEAIFHRKQRK